MKNPAKYKLSKPVEQALERRGAVVALESTVITHGLPQPINLTLAQEMEDTVRAGGAIPATVAMLDGVVRIGLSARQLQTLAGEKALRKISTRDFAPAIVQKASGGTTVAGTILAAHAVGIEVFATGGIGGVHWQPPYDISSDLIQLSRTPMVVVCAGAKAILNLPATLEVLETLGIPVIGYQCDEFATFYTRNSVSKGLKTSARADTPAEIARIARAHWSLGLESAVLVSLPPPEESALPSDEVDLAISQALEEAGKAGVIGQDVTPYLLQRVSQLTGGASLQANLALLLNNARLAAQVAVEISVLPH